MPGSSGASPWPRPAKRFEAARWQASTRHRRPHRAVRCIEGCRQGHRFGVLVYFSFFLVASALVLAALFFRLGVEQRAREVGLLRAVGFSTSHVRRLFVAEGLLLAAIGGALGMAGAVGYGAAMMAGLRTWWSGAVGTTSLTLHVSPISLIAGALGAMLAAVVCIWWTLRGLAGSGAKSPDHYSNPGRWPACSGR